MRLLDLFCGRGGWTNAFLDRGWECVGVDLVRHPDYRGQFVQRDVMEMTHHDLAGFDFVCASSPCEEFSVFGLKCFHPNPKHPETGIRLFNGARYLCEAVGIPFVLENVRSAERFVGPAVSHCGPFYLWGNAVPPILPQGIKKGTNFKPGPDRKLYDPSWNGSKSKARREYTARVATIPPELANCVCDYAEAILKMKISLPIKNGPSSENFQRVKL